MNIAVNTPASSSNLGLS